MNNSEELTQVLSSWFEEWQTLYGLHATSSPFFEPGGNKDGDEVYCNTYAEAYVLGVKEATKISDAVKEPGNLDPENLPDFAEAADHYKRLVDAAGNHGTELSFREGFKHGYRDKLRSSL